MNAARGIRSSSDEIGHSTDVHPGKKLTHSLRCRGMSAICAHCGRPSHRLRAATDASARLSFDLERASGNVGRLLDEDFCADLNAVVEVDHIGVVETKASGGNGVSDRIRLVCAEKDDLGTTDQARTGTI